MKIIPWAITLGLLLLAVVAWWDSKSGTQPDEVKQEPSPEKLISSPQPPPQPSPEPHVATLTPPDGFPKSHEGFLLESVKKEETIDGVANYFVAKYLSKDDSEISVRLLSLVPATSDQFTKNLLKALVTTESVKNTGISNLVVPKGWNSSHLFSREDAGIYIAHNNNLLVMVSAPSPDIAKSFGSTLHLTPP